MSNRKFFQDSVTPLPEQEGLTPMGLMIKPTTADNLEERLTILFSLRIPQDRNAELEKRVMNGETIPLDELNRQYAPKKAEVDKLIHWLDKHSFEVTGTSADGTGVYARATVSQIEKNLEVKMVRVTVGGLTYTAASNAPSLPADVGESVRAIIGLQPFKQFKKHLLRCYPKEGNRLTRMDTDIRPGTNVDNAPPYLASEILKAYNADKLQERGKGQTIAILIDTVPKDDDLQQFWAENKIPAQLNQIEKINVKNLPLPAPEGEETLDVEWASAIAPAATIRVYASGSLSFVDIDRALDAILADAAKLPELRQLSISLGLGETYLGGPDGEAATQHQKFLRIAALGVNVFVSSGDSGSNPDDTGHSSTGPRQVEHPASDPFVIAVGGTSLRLKPDGQVEEETGWPGSGGGESIFFQRPAWQQGKGVPPGTMRLVPDVSLAADPDTGAYLVLNGGVVQIGGTSWSAPVWAGFCALMNESRVNAGRPPLPFLNPLLYPLNGSPAFRDIQKGSNGAFTAQPGYDEVTGLGVPNMMELSKALLLAGTEKTVNV